MHHKRRRGLFCSAGAGAGAGDVFKRLMHFIIYPVCDLLLVSIVEGAQTTIRMVHLHCTVYRGTVAHSILTSCDSLVYYRL